MKLTREQISKLSDTELNRAMVWCYPDSKYYNGYYDEYMDYDYITDYNATMPLVEASDMEICTIDRMVMAWVGDIDTGHYIHSRMKPLLRSICEVLVMIAMEVDHGM